MVNNSSQAMPRGSRGHARSTRGTRSSNRLIHHIQSPATPLNSQAQAQSFSTTSGPGNIISFSEPVPESTTSTDLTSLAESSELSSNNFMIPPSDISFSNTAQLSHDSNLNFGQEPTISSNQLE